MYTIITSAKDCDDLSIGFDQDRSRRLRELTNNKSMKSKFQVRILLKNVFRHAEHQKKAT